MAHRSPSCYVDARVERQVAFRHRRWAWPESGDGTLMHRTHTHSLHGQLLQQMTPTAPLEAAFSDPISQIEPAGPGLLPVSNH